MEKDLVDMGNRVTTLEVLHGALTHRVGEVEESLGKASEHLQELREWRIAFTTRVAVYTTIGAVAGGIVSQVVIGLVLSLMK